MALDPLDALTQALVEAGAHEVTARGTNQVDGRLAAADIPTLAERLAGLGMQCQFLAAADTRGQSGDFTLVYAFASPALRPRACVLVSLDAATSGFPSLATRSFVASRFEREVHDLFGLVPQGHPDLRRLALHQFWPADYHPLRR